MSVATTLRHVGWATLVLVAVASSPAGADALAGLAPGPTDDARLAVAIGPAGQVYEPDGKGAWARTQRFAIATPVATVARGTSGVIASGGGAVYRLAANGWTAARLGQKAGKSLAGTGPRALAALGRDLFDLDRPGGEPVKIATASWWRSATRRTSGRSAPAGASPIAARST